MYQQHLCLGYWLPLLLMHQQHLLSVYHLPLLVHAYVNLRDDTLKGEHFGVLLSMRALVKAVHT